MGAVKNGHDCIVNILLDRGANPDMQTPVSLFHNSIINLALIDHNRKDGPH